MLSDRPEPVTSADGRPYKSKPERLAFIDSLRGLAALYVLAFHILFVPSFKPHVPSWARAVLLNGGSGVTLFFVVSAFTLCYTGRARRGEPRPVLRFYLRRFFRIAPLYYLWLFFMAVQMWGLLGLWHRLRALALLLTFGYNFVPKWQVGMVWASWTLGVEMVFYFAFPLAFRFINTVGRSLLFLALSLAVAAIYTAAIEGLPATGFDKRTFVHFSFLHQLPMFAVGMVVFFLYEWFVEEGRLSRRHSTALLCGSAGLGALLVLADPYFPILKFYGMAFVYGGLLLGLAARPVSAVVNPISVFYGDISYSLYLNHPLLVWSLSPFYQMIYSLEAMPFTLLFIACVAGTLAPLTAFSYLTYRFVDRPATRLGSTLARRLDGGRVLAYSSTSD